MSVFDRFKTFFCVYGRFLSFKFTVFLSFLERERDRDFEYVSDRDLVQYDCFRPFTVSDRSPFLTVHRS